MQNNQNSWNSLYSAVCEGKQEKGNGVKELNDIFGLLSNYDLLLEAVTGKLSRSAQVPKLLLSNGCS